MNQRCFCHNPLHGETEATHGSRLRRTMNDLKARHMHIHIWLRHASDTLICTFTLLAVIHGRSLLFSFFKHLGAR